MNRFQVHYMSNGEQRSYCIVESTTSAAKEGFLCYADEMSIIVDTVTSIELLKANVPATEKREREAISRIQQILDTLGPQSYVAKALDGCLAVAETNIDYDRVDSFKEQLSLMNVALDAVYSDVKMKDAIIETLTDQRTAESEEYERTIKDLQAEVHRLAAHSLSDIDATFVKSILHSQYEDTARKVNQLEHSILDTIDSKIDSGVDLRTMIEEDLTHRTELKKLLTKIDEIFDKF